MKSSGPRGGCGKSFWPGKRRLSKARIRTELGISRPGPQIGKINQKLEIRREQKDTCSSGRVGRSIRITEDITVVRGEGAIGEVRRLEDLVRRLEDIVLLSLERRLEGLIPLLLTRLLTLKQT